MSYYDDHVNPDTKWRELSVDELHEELGRALNRNSRLAGRIAALKIENGNLRQLIQCSECSELLGDAEPDGWMPNICPGCQAETYEDRIAALPTNTPGE